MESENKILIDTLIIKTDSVMESNIKFSKTVTEQLESQGALTTLILKKIELSDKASNKIFETIEDLYKQFAVLQESQKELKNNIQQILNWTRMN